MNLLNYKCFIIAVCMVLCGNICFSGFYSNDLHVQGVESGKSLSNVLTELHILTTLECLLYS